MCVCLCVVVYLYHIVVYVVPEGNNECQGGNSYNVADLVTTGNEQRTLSLHIALIHLDHLH